MKVFLIGTNFYSYHKSLEKALVDAGCEVKTYVPSFYWEKTTLGRIHQKIYKQYMTLSGKKGALYNKPIIVRYILNRGIFKMYESFKPDIIIGFPGYYISKQVLLKFKCIKIIWLYDSIKRLPFMLNKLSLYDKVYTFEGTDLPEIRQHCKSATFLPLCADQRVYYPIDNKYIYDVCFVGNLSIERIEKIKSIIDEIPGLRIKVFGRIPKGVNVSSKRTYSEAFTGRTLTPEEVNELYSKTLICLNSHHGQSKYGANMRFYEIMAAGGFQLVDSNPYIEDYFLDSVAVYHNDQELSDLIKYYMKHPEETIEKRNNGYKKATTSELFLHRAQKMLEN